jgi:hypothetical protein
MDVEEARGIMLNIYKSSITHYLQYLISVVVGFIGILTIEQARMIIFKYLHIPVYFFSLFIMFIIYFFGRALYYASLSEAILYVKPYNELMINKCQNKTNRPGSKYNLLWGFNETCNDYLRRRNMYENEELYRKRLKDQFASYFEDSLKSFIDVVFIIPLSILAIFSVLIFINIFN